MDGFTDRQLEIIRAIVCEYVMSGQPVGSQVLVNKNSLDISSATARKEMSILEQMGYLISPHTSAGRVPTDLAFQFYVNDLLSLYEITLTEKSKLENFYRQAKMQLDQLLQATASMLAMTSEYAGVVLSPVSTGSILKRVELVSVLDNLVLVIMISGSGSVYQKKIKLNKAVSQDDLYKISRFLNQRLKGYELSDLQDRGLEFLSEESSALADLREIAVAIAQNLVYNPPDQEVYVEGENSLYRQIMQTIPERADLVIHHLDNKNNISNILNRLKAGSGVKVQFGLDINGEHIEGISVLAKGYSIGGRNMGALGVIGINRMPYDKLIPTIDYSSQILSEVLNQHSDEQIDEVTEMPFNRTLPNIEE